MIEPKTHEMIASVVQSLHKTAGDKFDFENIQKNVRAYSEVNLVNGLFARCNNAKGASGTEFDALRRGVTKDAGAATPQEQGEDPQDDRDDSAGERAQRAAPKERSAQEEDVTAPNPPASSATESEAISLGLKDPDAFLPFDAAEHIRNCWLAASAILGIMPAPETLKARYFEALNQIQLTAIPHRADSVVLSFDNGPLIGCMIREQLIMPGDISAQLLHPAERPHVAARITDAFDFIRAVDCDLHDLIAQLIGTIVCFKRPGSSGTVSSMIGMLWLNPTPEWTVLNYAENIVHEFIHNTVFLADLVWRIFATPHYDTPPESLVISAIQKRPRGVNICFHSVFVAVGLALFMKKARQSVRAAELTSGLGVTIPQLIERQDKYLTETGRNWMDQFGEQAVSVG